MNAEIRECPLCAGKVISGHEYVLCCTTGCGIELKGHGRTRAGVEAAWNRRPAEDAAAARIAELEAALAPFVAYASLPGFRILPDEMPVTQGSRMAARQVTVADFRRALLTKVQS